jgi:hypothetical protein
MARTRPTQIEAPITALRPRRAVDDLTFRSLTPVIEPLRKRERAPASRGTRAKQKPCHCQARPHGSPTVYTRQRLPEPPKRGFLPECLQSANRRQSEVPVASIGPPRWVRLWCGFVAQAVLPAAAAVMPTFAPPTLSRSLDPFLWGRLVTCGPIVGCPGPGPAGISPAVRR